MHGRYLQVKAAEADALAMEWEGRGIAAERLRGTSAVGVHCCCAGMKESVEAFQKDVKGISSAEVLNMIMVTQYIDMLKEIGRTNVL